jgi:thioredoxin-like negative regulator of GroEL
MESDKMITIYKFTAKWCNFCKELDSTIDSIDCPHTIETIDIDEDQATKERCNVHGIPALIMFNDDVEVKRLVGAVDKNTLQNWIKE